jgi:hypothetical protein
LTNDGLTATEGLALHAVRAVRATGQGAADLAARTASTFVAAQSERVADAA